MVYGGVDAAERVCAGGAMTMADVGDATDVVGVFHGVFELMA